jgi:hypothetical protein
VGLSAAVSAGATAGGILELGPSSGSSEACRALPASGLAGGSGVSFIVIRSVSLVCYA